MKIVSIVAATLLMGSFLVASANEEVDTQIAAIQAATTPEERVELINEFKILLADMNAEDRQAAIDALTAAIYPKSSPLHRQITADRRHTRSRSPRSTRMMACRTSRGRSMRRMTRSLTVLTFRWPETQFPACLQTHQSS